MDNLITWQVKLFIFAISFVENSSINGNVCIFVPNLEFKTYEL